MNRLFLSLAFAALVSCASFAQEVIGNVHLAGPFKVQAPLLIDSVDASQKKYVAANPLDIKVSDDVVAKGDIVNLSDSLSASKLCVSKDERNTQLYILTFPFRIASYSKFAVKVKGVEKYKVYIDGKELGKTIDLKTGQYNAVVKFLADTIAPRIEAGAMMEGALSIVPVDPNTPTKRLFNMNDNMEMNHYYGVQISPSGKYAKYGYWGYDEKGDSPRTSKVVELATNKVIIAEADRYKWMPKSDKLLVTRKLNGKNQLISINPVDLSESVLCSDVPRESYEMSPTEDFLIVSKRVEGPKREQGVYEVLNPDDRQPGWRDRTSLSKFDLKTGISQQLTYGYKSMWLNDISSDGKYILFSVREDSLSNMYPTSLTTVCRLELATMKCDTLIFQDGFVNSCSFVPNTSLVAVVGGADSFDGIGRNLPSDMIPNAYDHQLFLLDANTKKVRPITKDFNPSIESVTGSLLDDVLFFTAQDKDSVSLYRLDTKTEKITKVIQPLETVSGMSISPYGTTMLYYGSSACVSDRLYVLNTKNLKSTMLDDCNAERMAQIELGTCHALSFKSSNGYELTGHYYLPANFDATKKYPIIVHYYGGCSPTSRRFGGGSHYPAHYWNANGYITLICNPSGASGFGQEWGARHVNTMGEGVAEDIIETVKYFADQNSWVDAAKIGCVSASYGGFMTQLLLTKTDMFAAGISHAGISDHTSYWGEGYWGYSYSQVCAAKSYPWTRKDLFVDRSPLYNADKIHTPLLFTHGTSDTNVPPGESIQMYTALKLLGVPTAFVLVEGENHGIMDFHKRQKWINTMVAWFDKHLKGDDSWWKEIYTPKDL